MKRIFKNQSQKKNTGIAVNSKTTKMAKTHKRKLQMKQETKIKQQTSEWQKKHGPEPSCSQTTRPQLRQLLTRLCLDA